jgi:gas vesicle protein
MFSRVRIAIRFFFVGLAVGVLLAPRSGRETRRLVRERADRLLNDVLDAATLGTYESGAGMTDDMEEEGESGNGSAGRPTARNGRTRSRTAESAAQA